MRIFKLLLALAPSTVLSLAVPSTDLDVAIQVISACQREIKLTVKITNQGNKDYNVLTSPASLFDATTPVNEIFPARKDDLSIQPTVRGVGVKWSPGKAVNRKQYVTVYSKKSVTYNHVLTNLYDFSKSGPGVYTLTPSPYVEILGSGQHVQLATYKYPPHAEITIPRSLNGFPGQFIFSSQNSSVDA